MKTSKRLILALLCFVLILSTTACSETNPQSSSSSSGQTSDVSTENTGETSAETEDLPEWFEGKDFSEKQVISIASIQVEDSFDYNQGDDFVKWWSENFNIEWDVTSLTMENWAERLRIWINSDDMPDMAVWDYKHGEATNYVDQGLLKALPQDWKENYPNLAKAASQSPMSEKTEEIFGDTYFLFRPVFSNNRPADKLSSHTSVYLRKDWADAIGYELKDVMKVSEILDFAAKVKEADPGNVGDAFYPLVGKTSSIAYFIGANSTYAGCGTSPYYQDENGVYQWGPASQETLEVLKMLSQAYRDGLIHPEFYAIQDPDDFGAFYTTGESAICAGEGMAWKMTEFEQHLSADLNLNYEDVVKVVAVVGEDGNYHGEPLTNYWGTNIFSPHISDEKLERILNVMDYSCTDEGQLMIRCGIEGVDWEMDENGNIISHIEDGLTARDKYAIKPLYENLMTLSDDFQFLDPNYAEIHRTRTKELYELREEHSTEESFPSEPDWTKVFHDSQAMNLASMTYQDEYAALIVKDGDIEENWKAWVNEKMPMIQPVLDELTEAANAEK